MKFKNFGLIILCSLLVGCENLNRTITCTDPDMYCDNNSVLASFKGFNGKTLSLFKINYIDNTLYYDSNDYFSEIILFVVNCSLIKDYYGNEDKISDTINFAFYLNSSCERYYDFNSIKNYLNKLDKFVFIYSYNEINDSRNLTYKSLLIKKEKSIENCSDDTAIVVKKFLPIIDNKLDYSGFKETFNSSINEEYFEDYIHFGMTLEELEPQFKKLHEDSSNYELSRIDYCF